MQKVKKYVTTRMRTNTVPSDGDWHLRGAHSQPREQMNDDDWHLRGAHSQPREQMNDDAQI
jgi:hypothetical protein